MAQALDAAALKQMFHAARSYPDWTDQPVGEDVMRELYDLLKFGPTSANSSPARFVWVRSAEGKARLAPLTMTTNQKRILTAPLTVIIGNDLAFAEQLPKLLPPDRVETMQKMFANPAAAEISAMRNGTLQGAYLMLAARALGMDCGPMSGFDNAAVDQEFFAGTRVQSNFLCCLGYGKPESVFPRLPRLTFEEAGWFA